MTFDTTAGLTMSQQALCGYLKHLVNRFFKILPIKENENGKFTADDLCTYITSLQAELFGLNGLIISIDTEPALVVLINILQYLKDNPDCDVVVVKREVFRAISICNKLRYRYTDPEYSEQNSQDGDAK